VIEGTVEALPDAGAGPVVLGVRVPDVVVPHGRRVRLPPSAAAGWKTLVRLGKKEGVGGGAASRRALYRETAR
jgi:hypothetical protein